MRDAMIVVVRVAAPQSVADMTLDCLPDWTVQQLKKLISERHELHPVSEFSFLQSSGLGLLTQISNYLSHTSIWTPVSNPWNEFGGGMSFRMSLAQSNKPKWSRDESGCRSLQKTEAELSRELVFSYCRLPFFPSPFWACIQPDCFVSCVYESISTIWGGSRLPPIEIWISSDFTTVWNWPKMDLEWVSSPPPPNILPIYEYFLVITAQWNFLHSFFSSIPPDVLGLILKF